MSIDRLRFTFLIFFAEFKANASLLVATITTCYAKFCAPLLHIKMSLMYFFLTVTLKRLFYSVKRTETSDMKVDRHSSLVNSEILVKFPPGFCSMYSSYAL